MHETLDDPVDVIVAFKNNRVLPRRLQWNGNTYDIETINMVHTVREGKHRVFYFSVSDKANNFKLRLDPQHLEWRLIELYTP